MKDGGRRVTRIARSGRPGEADRTRAAVGSGDREGLVCDIALAQPFSETPALSSWLGSAEALC